MLSKNIETFIGCDKEFDEADFVIFGAPFDSTTSYRPGARFGSKAMRGESFGLETYSPYKDKDLLDSNVFDGGDLELCFGNTKRVIDDIKNYELYILNNNKLPIMIGGEHLVTLGGVAAAVEKYGDICIVHFDAHADLREDYLGEKLSHACVIRRCNEIIGEGKVYQFGIRSGEKAEFDYAKTATVMNKFNFNGIDKACKEIGDKPVYLTIDLDVLDSAVFPGTGTPEAGGVSFMDLIGAIDSVSNLNIIGADVTELCPIYDQSGISTATACKILRELILALDK